MMSGSATSKPSTLTEQRLTTMSDSFSVPHVPTDQNEYRVASPPVDVVSSSDTPPAYAFWLKKALFFTAHRQTIESWLRVARTNGLCITTGLRVTRCVNLLVKSTATATSTALAGGEDSKNRCLKASIFFRASLARRKSNHTVDILSMRIFVDDRLAEKSLELLDTRETEWLLDWSHWTAGSQLIYR